VPVRPMWELMRYPEPEPTASARFLLHALREGIDTATPSGRAVAAIMATLAELELDLGRVRHAASRQSRRSRGLAATKPRRLSPERQQQLPRWPRPVSPHASWPTHSESDERPPTATYLTSFRGAALRT